jgi:PAS domain S-box-containing protein
VPIRWPRNWNWHPARPKGRPSAGRAAADEALRASEEKFAAAFALSPLAISLTALPSGQFIEVNEALLRLTGYRREELIGRTPVELGLWADETVWAEGRAVLAREGRLPQTEARFRRKDGGIIVGLAAAERIDVAGQPAILTVIADITERRRVEASLQASARRAAFRVALGDALRPLSDPDAIQAESARLLGEHLGVNRAFYAEAEADGQHVVVRQEFRDGVPDATGRYRLDDFGPARAKAMRTGRTVTVDDVAAQGALTAEERENYAAFAIRAHATIPLIKDGRLVGLLGVRDVAPRAWTADEVALMEEVAERTWAASERARAEAALRASEERLALALVGARAGAWQWDLTTQRVIWSPEYYALLGLPFQRGDHSYGTHPEIIHPDDRERVRVEFAALSARGGPFELEFRVVRPDGAELWLSSVGRVECDAAGRPVMAIGISQDITARRQAEDRVRLLAEVSALLAGTLDEGAALDALARLLVGTLADWCLVSTLEADGQIHRRAFAHVDREREALLRQFPAAYPYDPAQSYGAASVIASGRSRFSAVMTPEDLARRTSPAILSELQDLGVASGMIVPLRARGRTFGAISLLRTNPARPFVESDLALAEQVADRAAVTLDSARLYAAERAARAAAERAARWQATLADASRLFAEAGPGLQPLLDATARYLVELIGDGCLIGLVAADGARIALAAADHRDPETAAYSRAAFGSTPMQVGLGVIGGTVSTGRATLLPVVDRAALLAAAEPELRPIIERHTPHSLMAAPCRAGGRTIGVIAVARHSPGQPYTDDDLALLSDLADRAALAIERARLYDAEQTARTREGAARAQLALLADAGIVLAGSLDEEATLSSLAALLVPALADWCTINLVGDDGLRPPIAVHADPTRRAALDELLRRYPANPRGEGPVGRVLRTGEPVLTVAPPDDLIRDHAPDDAYLALLAAVGLASTIIVPLRARERLLGALRLARVDHARPYDNDDLRLAEELARRAALALDNARLFSETRDAVAVRDRFLSIAAHELRTPVTSMRAYAQLVRRQRDRGDLAPALIDSALTAVERGTTRLNTLIQDLLEVARLQSGQLRIERAPLDLVALVRMASEEAQTQLPAGLRLTVACDVDSYAILGDAGRLEQVLGNLLENARKYSPEGGLIAVTLTTDEQGATVAVRDEGIGLSPAETQTIFTPFNRSEEALRRQIQGLGLGLAICRAIVEEHGGTLEATSAGYGHGTVFTLRLPAPPRAGATDLDGTADGDAAEVEVTRGGAADPGGGGR